jgi:hypothetical protein
MDWKRGEIRKQNATNAGRGLAWLMMKGDEHRKSGYG